MSFTTFIAAVAAYEAARWLGGRTYRAIAAALRDGRHPAPREQIYHPDRASDYEGL